ncbi:MAG: tRNA (guanine(37)-N(1))-methyltransferase, partial [Mucispirillum sp.]|nr:tRNA (guanine(37)-N(1))-methyltransferase [Mucispirillum sp.]
MKTYNIITIFPDMIDAAFKQGVISKAIEKGLLSIHAVNLRDYAEGNHLITDDYQYGGGAGLVMKPEPICEAVDALKRKNGTKVVLLDPRGIKFNQGMAEDMA